MIDIKINIKFNDIKKFVRRFGTVNQKIGVDAYKLGIGCYKYLKGVIPVSKLNKPHLRDSFKVRVHYLLEGVIVGLYPDGITYAPFVDMGATIPMRRARHKKAMRFETKSGEVVFTMKAKGFRLKGIRYVSKGERWFARNAHNFIDFSLKKYLK